jgi:orotate phosphoribosyltransferase
VLPGLHTGRKEKRGAEKPERAMLQSKAAADRHALSDDDARKQFRQIIKSESLLRGDFTLASGQKSSFFLDLKKTMFHPHGAWLAAEIIFEMIKRDTDVDYIGGLEIGAIPIVVAVCARSWPERPIKAFFVRKAVKDHGTTKLIDGQFRPGSNVILFEDVTTTGGSVMKAVHAVRGEGAHVKKILTIVDRGEGARDNLKREGLDLVSIFTMDDLAD